MPSEKQKRTRRSFLGLGVLTSLAASARPFGVSLAASEAIAQLRRVVTARNRAGKAIMVQNGVSPRVVTTETLPGLTLVEVWATDTIPTLPIAPVDLTTTMGSFVPGPGGTRFRIVQFPGASSRAFDQEAFRREYLVKAPGLAEAMERQDSGMHTTDSVDYGVVISGEITLELDDGATVNLKQGDCVVQNGTRHAWRNRSRTPCVMAFVLVGAAKRDRSG
jgi:mannose-6-phosphate isomerase-like protein (cupin superfamily)